MNCQQVQDWLGDDSVGILNGADKQAFDAHLAHCDNCLAEYRRFHRCMELLNHIPRPVPPLDLWAGVRARMDLERSVSSGTAAPVRKSPIDTWWGALVTAAAGFAVVMGIFSLTNDTPTATAAADIPPAIATVSVNSNLDVNNPLVDGTSVYAIESMTNAPPDMMDRRAGTESRAVPPAQPGDWTR